MSLTESTPLEVASAASTASRQLATLQCEARNEALTLIHEELQKDKDSILAANAKDLELAIQAAENGELSQSVLKRLDLGRKGKWDDMLQGILDVRDLEDPVGKITLRTRLDEGLELERVTCPIGVLLIIFEARPEVIANIASLAIKSGNAAILKGGKETTLSFLAISTTISTALSRSRVPNTAIQLVATRDAISSLLDLDNHIDLVIPRGSNDLVRYIKHHTRIPVLGHADGLCSIYIHEDADPDMAVKVILDAKLDYPAACNAVETLLIDESALPTLLPPVATALLENGVSLRCDAPSKTALTTHLPPHLSTFLQPSTPADYTTEFLSPTLALLTLPTPSPPSPTTACNNAITHINTHSSHHTDAILTSSATTARQFQQGIDSACVFWNTSTRMADGMRFGFGTEVGISTNKVHARGPVGLEGLCVYKYLVGGRGQVAGEYGGEGGKRFLHEKLALDG
ncbi:glutamate-5-semialdehyde dehydrogenase [Lecanora helva]